MYIADIFILPIFSFALIINLINLLQISNMINLSINSSGFIMQVSRETGIVLDPTYTGKTALALVKELKNNPHRFKGTRILFIHTGRL